VAIPLGTSNSWPSSAANALGVAVNVFVGTETLVGVEAFVGVLVVV
jgi:hypothetical protein